MKAKITDNTPAVINQKKLAANSFLLNLVDTIERESRGKTPKKSGDLRDVKKSVLGLSAKMIWDQPYAQYQERGMRKDGTRVVRNYTTPGTGAHFAESTINSVLKKVGQIVKATGGL